MLAVGDVVAGRYAVEARIAGEGPGVFFRAVDLRAQRPVALEVRPELVAQRARAERFLEEARALAAVEHPGVARALDAGWTAAGAPFLAGELFDGVTLRRRLGAAPLDFDGAVAVVGDVLDALGAAHGAGFVHRAVRPENVLLTSSGTRLAGFELSAAWGSAEALVAAALGGIAYLAPEQLGDGAVDGRADLWAAGVVLHEVVTGVLPFRLPGYGDALSAQRAGRRPPLRELAPDAPDALAALLDRCLSPDPSARPGGAAEVAAALRAVPRFALRPRRAG